MRLIATALGLALALAATGPLRAAKPDTTLDWRCRLQLRDAASDTVRSDNGTPYVDGVGGAGCYIVNAPGATHDRWLFVNITVIRGKQPARSVRYIGQQFEGASYPSFENHGTFEVKGLAKVPWNPLGPSARDVMPFRAYLRHPDLPFDQGLAALNGDSNVTGGLGADGTSSVFVQPVDACTWQITSYTVEEPDQFIGASGERVTRTTPRVMRITEGKNSTLVGDFPMAFGATVTITANKAGCPLT